MGASSDCGKEGQFGGTSSFVDAVGLTAAPAALWAVADGDKHAGLGD